MPRFSSPAKQAGSVMKVLQGRVIKSIGTSRNYEQAYRRISQYLHEQRLGSLQSMTVQQAVAYLDKRSQFVRQSTLNMERQALQAMMRHITHLLAPDQALPSVQAAIETELSSRAYTAEQVDMIAAHQIARNSLATEIAYRAGLRAHELYTLRLATERHADVRPATPYKFNHRPGILYTVQGKGGLIREVCIPPNLSRQLEAARLPHPAPILDRNIRYQSYYDLNGGQRWSSSFTKVSKRVLGWSEGGHGVRHAYAQERMDELRAAGLDRNLALETVSQELGHFRPSITEIYLR